MVICKPFLFGMANNYMFFTCIKSAFDDGNFQLPIVEKDVADTKRKFQEKKSFQCNICTFKFSCRAKLKVHLQIHNGEKPFECNICNYKCTQTHNLKRHLVTSRFKGSKEPG